MRIIYLANVRMPTPRAHGLQIMQTCAALARAGAEVELVIPDRANDTNESPFLYYGLPENFSIVRLPVVDLLPYRIPFAFNILGLSFVHSLTHYLAHAPENTVLYMRGEIVVPVAHRWGKKFPIFWETHEPPRHTGAYKRALARAQGIVTVTEQYREELIRKWGFAPERVHCVRDAVDLAAFDAAPGRVEARRLLNLPLDKKIAIYTGTDLSWKGLGTLRAAAGKLPDEWLVVFVGSITPEKGPRSVYPGYRPRKEIPLWLSAADVLILTGTAKSDSSARYTSPMKLFEYMAAGRAVVASDLPSFREVLDDSSAYFVAPDNSDALATEIQHVVGDSAREEKAARAKALVAEYSWDKRGSYILDFIKMRL